MYSKWWRQPAWCCLIVKWQWQWQLGTEWKGVHKVYMITCGFSCQLRVRPIPSHYLQQIHTSENGIHYNLISNAKRTLQRRWRQIQGFVKWQQHFLVVYMSGRLLEMAYCLTSWMIRELVAWWANYFKAVGLFDWVAVAIIVAFTRLDLIWFLNIMLLFGLGNQFVCLSVCLSVAVFLGDLLTIKMLPIVKLQINCNL